MADRNAQIVIGLRNQASPEVKALANDYRALVAEFQKGGAALDQAERKMLSLAQAKARAQLAAGDLAGSERTLTAGLSVAARETTTLYGAQTQLSRVQQGGIPIAEQFGQSVQGAFLGILGPAALVTGAIQGVQRAGQALGQEFGRGLVIKASLDQTNASIGVLLGSVRDTGQVFSQASAFANRFKLTQQETAGAVLAANQVIRQSKAPIDEVLTTLARLRVLNPQEDFAGAARALSELNAGDIVSIVDRFNVSRKAANQMKAEIAGGADAVQVLAQYLDTAGVGMSILEQQTRGAAGAMRDLKRAEEERQLAAGAVATGPGIQLIQTQTLLYRGLAQVYRGDLMPAINDGALALFNFANLFGPLGQSVAQNAAQVANWSDQSNIAASIAARVGGAFDDERRAAAALSGGLDLAANATRNLAAAQGALASLPKALDDTSKVVNIDPRKQVVTNFKNALGGGLKGAFQEQANEARRVATAQLQYDLSRTTNASQRIAIYQRELAQTTDQAERLRIMAQIEQERASQARTGVSAAKAHTTELSKQRNLQEGIYDSVNKQARAEADLRAARAQGVLDTLKENKELKTAQAILQSDRASAEFKQIAQAKIDLINANRDQRKLREDELAATAGAQIIGGKLYQSQPGAGALTAGGGGAGAAGSAVPAGGGSSSAVSGGGQAIVLQLTDGGRVLAQTIEPFVMDALLAGVRHVRVSKGT